MKTLGWVLALSLLAVLLAAVLRYSPGYVLVVVPPYRVELSVGLALIGLAGVFALGYLLLRAGSRLAGLPGEVRAWRARGQRERGEAALAASMRALLAGRYGRASESAQLAYAEGAAPAVSSLIAARAAHELRRFEQRDRHLAQANQHDADDPTARLMAQAGWLADEGRVDEALAVLATLPAQHTAALRLEFALRQRLAQWDEARAVVDRLVERDALAPADRAEFERNFAREAFRQHPPDAASANAAWQRLPEHLRVDRDVALNAAQVFADFGQTDLSRTIIERALDSQWDGALLLCYSNLARNRVIDGATDATADAATDVDERAARIERCEQWLTAHPNDSMLLLSLGRLYVQAARWDKAQSNLEASLSIEPSYNAHLALAQLHQALNHHEAAARHREQALELAVRALDEATGGRRRQAR